MTPGNMSINSIYSILYDFLLRLDPLYRKLHKFLVFHSEGVLLICRDYTTGPLFY